MAMRTLSIPPMTWTMTVVLLLSAAGVGLAPTARADALDDAQRAWEQGEQADAAQALRDWLLLESEDPARLLDAARLASRLGNLDLIARTLVRVETAATSQDDPALDLAAALASYTLASERLARGIPDPTLAMLFADAEEAAGKARSVPGLAQEADGLFARIRWAVGDVDGAIAALEAYAPPSREGVGDLQLLRGRLLYDRAVTKGLGADGRPTEDGKRDLGAALDALGAALVDLPPTLPTADLLDLWMTLGWAAHRAGRLGAAEHAYQKAWEVDPASTLPLRGLQSLLAYRPGALTRSLETLEASASRTLLRKVLPALAASRARNGNAPAAFEALEALIALDAKSPIGWIETGRLHLDLGQAADAEPYLVKALEVDPSSNVASGLLDRVARSFVETDRDKAFGVYEALLALRPDDPYVRNNYAFLLREAVSPHTTEGKAGIQTLKSDAPPEARTLLDRCIEVYAEAAALVDDEADLDEDTAWTLAGIVNDYALMLHYFQDVQDGAEAERQYFRALEMTDYAFKDTYVPNLRRLYATVLPHRMLTLYAAARKARDAILLERPTAEGGFQLVPDLEKQAIAARDVEAIRAGIYGKMKEDAREDGAPWPPPPPK